MLGQVLGRALGRALGQALGQVLGQVLGQGNRHRCRFPGVLQIAIATGKPTTRANRNQELGTSFAILHL